MADFDSQGKGPYLVAILGGLLASIVATNVCRVLGIWGTEWWYLVAAMAYLIVGIAVFLGPVRLTFAPFMIVYAAIPFGIVIDAAFDLAIWNYDRNLFPFEIALHFMFAWAPLLVGALIGRSVRSSKQLQATASCGG